MRVHWLRVTILVGALTLAAFGTVPGVSATQGSPPSRPHPAATVNPTETATPAATPTSTTISLAMTVTPTATPAASPPPDQGIDRFEDACTHETIEVDAAPRLLAERESLTTGGSRVTVRLQRSPLLTASTPYSGGASAPTVVELESADAVIQQEVIITLTASGGHTLTLTYLLNVSSDAATATLSRVSGHCGR